MQSVATETPREVTIRTVCEELGKATAATKCHACGCLRDTIEALTKAAGAAAELKPLLEDAHRVLAPKKYDCLGCDICFPAVAANAFAETFPDAMPDAAFCPTEAPVERSGWPQLPGDYSVVRFGAPVAVCTLNSNGLVQELAGAAPDGLAIVGTMHTENLGIERIIRNVLANANIRFLILCGDDTRQLIGHLPGQSLESLFTGGIDEKQRIIGAKGKRPFLKNVSREQIALFTEQVKLVSMIGEQDASQVKQMIAECHAQGLPKFDGAVVETPIETVVAKEPQFYKSDPAGFFVVYPDSRTRRLVIEHYANTGTLDCVIEGSTPAAVYVEIVKRGLVSQLDHAAYLGRELAKAEHSLEYGASYNQDGAPGMPELAKPGNPTGSCGPTCKTCH